jgi:hypothetical protein
MGKLKPAKNRKDELNSNAIREEIRDEEEDPKIPDRDFEECN